MKNKLLIIMLLFMFILSIASCGKKGKEKDKEEVFDKIEGEPGFKVYDSIDPENLDFDRDLYYMNTIQFEVADPSVIYAYEGAGAGYFYAFGTSDEIHCHGYQCWRSKDLANWEYTSVALKPTVNYTWAYNNYWAPEVIYDEEAKLYFMFYNADNLSLGGKKCISMAYSETPYGPYIIPDGQEDYNGNILSETKPIVNFEEHKAEIPANIDLRYDAIDSSPFIDPVTGKKYLYWSWYGNGYEQEIFGMEMYDWFTPNYSTITQITDYDRATIGALDRDVALGEGQNVNEAPFMIYHDGTYMMTFSTFNYQSSDYQVRTAVCSTPLGDFKKLYPSEGGTVIKTGGSWGGYISSAGHHCFIKAGDQYYIAYHTFLDRATISEGRALAVDEIEFVKNSKGQTVIHSNGPTYSLQPIPTVISGFKNVAPTAKISVTGNELESDPKLLNDNVIKIHGDDQGIEYEFSGKSATIKLDFDAPINLKSIMVYNSCEYETAIAGINKATVDVVVDEKGHTQTVNLGTLLFDYDFNADVSDNSWIHPGSAVVVETEELPIKSITLNINNGGDDFRISEIKVMANENNKATFIKNFKGELKYSNEVVISDLQNQGKVLGSTYQCSATYGWDFTHDDGSISSYITTDGVGDSFAYFKDVVCTKFYAEAFISTYSMESFNNDKYPKFGMVVRNAKSCTFFYIDAANSYTQQQVGYTQSVYGDPANWDWSGSEQTIKATISYANNELTFDENFAKIAILRDGAKFYFYIDDMLVFESDSLRALGDNDLASVGFLGFNTPMVVYNYHIYLSDADINAKIANLSK